MLKREQYIDLSKVDFPDFVEAKSPHEIERELKDTIRKENPNIHIDMYGVLGKVIRVFSLHYANFTNQTNQAARQTCLGFATGKYLDVLAQPHGVARREGESDDEVRKRTFDTIGGMSGAGNRSSFETVAFKAASEFSEAQKNELVAVKAVENFKTDEQGNQVGTGVVGIGLIFENSNSKNSQTFEADKKKIFQLVREALEDYRPLGILLDVYDVQAIEVKVEAKMTLKSGVDKNEVLKAATKRLETYFESIRYPGSVVYQSGIIHALYDENMYKVVVNSPSDELRVWGDENKRYRFYPKLGGLVDAS